MAAMKLPSRLFQPVVPLYLILAFQLLYLAQQTISFYLCSSFYDLQGLNFTNMAGIGKLIPAFTAHINIDPPSAVGSVARGTDLLHVKIRESEGSLKSEPGYPIKVDAVFVHGSDYIRLDPDKKNARLQVDSVLKDAGGGFIKLSYTGTIKTMGPAGKVLGGAPDAKTTDFGEVFTHVSFETGSDALKEIEEKVYVSAGRFILEEGKPAMVEYKISEVAA